SRSPVSVHTPIVINRTYNVTDGHQTHATSAPVHCAVRSSRRSSRGGCLRAVSASVHLTLELLGMCSAGSRRHRRSRRSSRKQDCAPLLVDSCTSPRESKRVSSPLGVVQDRHGKTISLGSDWWK